MIPLIDKNALFREMEKAQWYNNADRDEVAEELVLNAPIIEIDTDTVSRQAALENVCTMLRNCFDASDEMIESVKITVGELPPSPSRQAEPHWIPCSERLPDEDHHIVNGIYRSDIVFVTVVNHDADDDTFTDMAVLRDCQWQLYHFDDGDADIPEWCEVTAWMPLPQPYKAK